MDLLLLPPDISKESVCSGTKPANLQGIHLTPGEFALPSPEHHPFFSPQAAHDARVSLTKPPFCHQFPERFPEPSGQILPSQADVVGLHEHPRHRYQPHSSGVQAAGHLWQPGSHMCPHRAPLHTHPSARGSLSPGLHRKNEPLNWPGAHSPLGKQDLIPVLQAAADSPDSPAATGLS